MALNLPQLATTLSVWRTAAIKASADLKGYAAAHPGTPAAETALEAAADIDAALNALAVVDITSTSMDELKALVLAGKGIVHHQAADTF
jgi:hypothetical protein